jgi:hypothetical protein
MTDLPEDAVALVTKIAALCREVILMERERCARIADDEAERMSKCAEESRAHAAPVSEEVWLRAALTAASIRNAIRKG